MSIHGRRWLPREEFVKRLSAIQADPGLRDDLARLAGDTTDDLEPLNSGRKAPTASGGAGLDKGT